MSDLISAILKYPLVPISCFAIYCLLRLYTLKRMFDNDAGYEETDGNKTKKGYHRNIWDLSAFPGLSKLFFTNGEAFLATIFLAFFVFLYIFVKEQWMAEVIKVNFGLVIGALIGTKNN